jgi:hypothetical protein
MEMRTWIHVNQFKIKANLKNGTNEPAIIVRQKGKAIPCRKVKIMGSSEVLQAEGCDTLVCRARVAIRTDSKVIYE